MTHHHHHEKGVLPHLKSLLELIVVALFVATFLLQPSRIPTESMAPTLKPGDFLLVNKQAFSPRGGLGLWGRLTGVLLPRRSIQRGDVVIFHYPIDPQVDVVKRVVALGGDRLHLRAGKLFVNDAPVAEPYAAFTPTLPDAFRDDFPALHNLSADVEPAWWPRLRTATTAGDLLVPPDSLFVLGDNRNNSLDSRYWGFVPAAAIEGRPLAVILSAQSSSADTLPQRFAHLFRDDHRVQ